jgi:hypothetical protein
MGKVEIKRREGGMEGGMEGGSVRVTCPEEDVSELHSGPFGVGDGKSRPGKTFYLARGEGGREGGREVGR